jgi:crotonobetainyl-CoA:carnitine CoA-transferase CaiB-like acyl-CoA transferase
MASEVGEHTREILRELDFGDREIGALIERGAVFIKEKA